MQSGRKRSTRRKSMSSEFDLVAYEMVVRNAVWPKLPIIMAEMESEDGPIVYVSRFAADIFGYTPEELLGQPIETLVPESLHSQHKSWRRDASVPKMRLMGQGRQIYGRRKDGALFPVHVGLTSTEVAGKQIGVAFVVDLTGVTIGHAMEEHP